VRQSTPFSHAQSTGQLHIPIHHREMWVIWVAYCKEATIQVYLMYNIMFHTLIQVHLMYKIMLYTFYLLRHTIAE
jgi:hypothetical protein